MSMSNDAKISILLCYWVFLMVEICNCITIKEIYVKSFNEIGNGNEQKLENILKEHYFTDKKENSIWWLANKEAVKTFNLTLGFDHLLSMETTIQKMNSHFHTCTTMKKNKRRSQCLNRFLDLIKDAERDFIWDPSSTVSKEGRAKLGCQYTAYSVFSSILATLVNENLHLLGNFKNADDITRRSINVLEILFRMFHRYESAVIEWRTDQISPVKICEINSIFWKRFTGTCETRWKRDVGEDDDVSSESEIYDDNDNDDPKLDIADRIGGANNYRTKVYRAEVRDSVNKKTIYEKEVIVSGSKVRGTLLKEVYHEGIKKRWIAEKDALTNMEHFHQRTISPARKVFTKVIKYLQTFITQ